MQQKVLVTGGAGFIGSHLVERLLSQGARVTVLDDLSGGRNVNLHPQAELIRGDVLDTALLARAMEGVGSVFHLAACVSVQECIADWSGGHRINLGGTIAVLQAARWAGNLPVVYASSAAVYGNPAHLPCAERDLPMPISPYAADKLGCEHQARAMAEVHGLPSVGLRFFNVYGPRQAAISAYAGVISRFCANRMADQEHVIFGDGGQSRDFIYVLDVVDGLIRARDLLGRARGAHVFNLSTGTEVSLLELAQRIDAVSGRPPSQILHQPARGGDIRASRGATELARDQLGFRAETGITAGLAQLWNWLSDQPKGAEG